MKIIEKYTGEKTYMFPNGAVGTREAVLRNTPAALMFTHVVETDENGEIMWALNNLSALRSIYNIDRSLTEDEAIAAIQEIVNTPPEENNVPSAGDRIAAALEYQIMASMPDGEV